MTLFRARLAGVLCWAILVCWLFAFSQQDTLSRLYQQAQEAQQAGDYPTATRNYEQIVNLEPAMAEAHANLGILYFLQGETEKATRSLRKAIQLKPQLAGPYLFLGVLSFNGRNYEEALKNLRTAEKLDPANLLIHQYLGYTQYGRSDFLAATHHLEFVAEQQESDQDVFYHLSKSYGHLSQQFFDRLQREFPGTFSAHLARAHFYEGQQNWQRAQEEYAEALQQEPHNLALQQRLQWITSKAAGSSGSSAPSQLGDEKVDGSTRLMYDPPQGTEIKEELQKYRHQVDSLSSRTKPSAEELYRLAEAYQALSYLASLWVFEVVPDSYRAHQMKGQYYEALDKEQEAVAEYRRALQLKPDLQNVHFSIGNLYWRKGRLDAALPELSEELRINPHHPQALYEIGDILFAQGNSKEAEKYFLKALELEPAMIEAHLALERIYTNQEEHSKALQHLQKVIELQPQDFTAHYRLATIYRKMGKMEEARREMEIFQQLKSEEEKSPKP